MTTTTNYLNVVKSIETNFYNDHDGDIAVTKNDVLAYLAMEHHLTANSAEIIRGCNTFQCQSENYAAAKSAFFKNVDTHISSYLQQGNSGLIHERAAQILALRAEIPDLLTVLSESQVLVLQERAKALIGSEALAELHR